MSQLEHSLPKLMARFKFAGYLLWTLVAILWLAAIAAAYFAWFAGLSELWAWSGTSLVRGLVAILGSLLLLMVPFWVAMIAYSFTGTMTRVSVSPESITVQRAQERVRETEEDALGRLESTDSANLLPLLRYSRAQLDAYYAIGLEQTRRGFFNAVVAMWLGFVILILGVALYIGPVERFGLQRPDEDFNTLILSSAAIVEFISALFLWVYRSTISQLTFYYRLQMRSHTAILCFRMASTMAESDEAKRAIIASILDASMTPEQPPTPANRLMGLVRKSQG